MELPAAHCPSARPGQLKNFNSTAATTLRYMVMALKPLFHPAVQVNQMSNWRATDGC